MQADDEAMLLADPPLVEHYLFESPTPLAVTLAGAGLILLYHGSRRRHRRLMLAALLPLILSATVLALAAAVTTTRELLIARTSALLAAAASADLPRLRGFFAPEAMLVGPTGAPWLALEPMLEELERTTRRHVIESHEARQLLAQSQGLDEGQSELDLRTFLAGEWGRRPIATRWLLTWSREADGSWRVQRVQWLSLEGRPPLQGSWR